MWSFKPICAAALVVVLAGCGFQPIYGTADNRTAGTQLAAIGIQPIRDRVGQMLRNDLLSDISPLGQQSRPAFSLSVVITESTSSLGVTKSEIATRANLRLSAKFTLNQVSPGKTLFSATSDVINSYNILTSDFATLEAENDARRRGVRELSQEIKNRLVSFFLRNPNIAASGPPPSRRK